MPIQVFAEHLDAVIESQHAVTNLSTSSVTQEYGEILNGLAPHRLLGVMIKGAPIGRSFAFHGAYYRSHDAIYREVSKY